jgi:hypothetical protein
MSRLLLVLSSIAVLLAGNRDGGVQAADVADVDRAFSEHLSAGEFGPALKLAERTPGERDRMLARLAMAQGRAGVRFGALNTISSMDSDSQRQAAYGTFANQPVFGGARGGASLADFDSLIQLIESTIAPDTWANAGGVGAIEPFPGGVYVDSAGTLKRLHDGSAEPSLLGLRRSAIVPGGNRDVRESSVLRKVSLTRLERQIQRRIPEGRRPDESMEVLAGLTRVKYLLVYPDSRDIVIAGPAGDWTVDREGRTVSAESGRPTLRLDDLVVVLRNALASEGRFGCSITPRRENLETVQAFLSESSAKPVRAGGRDAWLADLQKKLGVQDITVHGLNPGSHAARVLVEADYRMKLVGMGLEPGVLGVSSYLDMLEVSPGGSPPPMDVLRWWFTLNYDALRTTTTRDAFEWAGPGVKVLSENELLTERGERVHTGEARDLNQQFAQRFTEHFEELAVKYPIYAELRNVFDLALVAAIIRSEDLASQCSWEMTCLGDKGTYRVELGTAPKVVSSVINHRQIDRQRFVVGVSGGVLVDTRSVANRSDIKTDTYGLLKAERGSAVPPDLQRTAWWWD